MDETTQATHAKDEFFSADMYVFHVTGFPPPPDVLTRKAEAPPGARLDVWRTDPASDRHIPGPGAEGVAFSTADFSLVNSGNRTLRTPKRSWKISLDDASGDAGRLAGMTCVNLKSMYNDPSQMREALAWRLFGRAGVPAPRHTYAKLAFDATYYGLFSVIEQVDKRFLKDHFGGNHRGNLYKAYCGDVGCATLEHRAGPNGDDSGRQYYKVAAADDRTYRLKTNEDDPGASTYDDLALFIRTINGMALGDGDRRFDTDAFRESVDGIMNAPAFLRWAAVNVLLGSWDNYYATPSNYYLYNSGRLGAEDDFMRSPYFTFIPWDYDNCLGLDYFDTKWQYTDILDWPGNTRRYWRDRAISRIPLVQNLLRNRDYRQYYLDYLELLLDTEFNPDSFSQQIASGAGDGLWGRTRQAAYLESATPYGQPFTGRQFTNDEVYLSGCQQNELRHGQEKAEGIIHYVRMRYDSARQQLEQLRKQTPRANDSGRFPATVEPLSSAALPDDPGGKDMVVMHTAMQQLELVSEAKMSDILPGSPDPRLEASGVLATGEMFYVIFDNLPHIACISPELSPAATGNHMIVQERGLRSGFEDIAHDPHAGRFYVLIESLPRGRGLFMAAVQEYDANFRYAGRAWLDFPLDRPNKGLEGLACVRRDGQVYLLALCEGNRCKGGAEGRVPGGGRVQVFRRGDRQWDRVARIRLPETVLFQDYSGLAVTGGRIAVVSQESSALWVGNLAPDGREFTGAGMSYALPRSADGSIVYGTAEGVSWMAPDEVVMVSDKAKPDQDPRCRAKDQSIHIFRIPASAA